MDLEWQGQADPEMQRTQIPHSFHVSSIMNCQARNLRGVGCGSASGLAKDSLDPATLKKSRKLSGTTCFTSLQTFTGGFVKTIATRVGQVSAINPIGSLGFRV